MDDDVIKKLNGISYKKKMSREFSRIFSLNRENKYTSKFLSEIYMFLKVNEVEMKLCIKTDTIRGFVRIVEGMVDNLYKEIEDWLKPKFIESNGGMRSHKSKKIVEAVKKGACDGDSIEHCESFDAKKTSVKDRLDEIDRKIASQETSIDLLSELIAARAPVSDLDTLKSGCIELTERIEKLESTVEKNKR